MKILVYHIFKMSVKISSHFFIDNHSQVVFKNHTPDTHLTEHGGTAQSRAWHRLHSYQQPGEVTQIPHGFPMENPAKNSLRGWKATLLFWFPARTEELETEFTVPRSALRDKPLLSQLWNVNNFCLSEYPPWFCQNPSHTTACSSKK